MSVTVVFPDPVWDIRYWLRNHPILNPLHGGRVYLRLPSTTIAPMLRISRVGGGQQQDTEAPISDIQLVVEVWGMQNKDYQAVRQLIIAIEHVCNQLAPGTLASPTGTTILDNANFTTGFDSPDPQTGWPRMICHIIFTVKPSAPLVIG